MTRLRYAIVSAIVCIFVFTTHADQVPADWSKMETGKWYDSFQESSHLIHFQCDPYRPGWMYGFTGYYKPHYFNYSSDFGKTWVQQTEAIQTEYGELEEVRKHTIWFGAHNQQVHWLVGVVNMGTDRNWDGHIVLLKRYSLNDPWITISDLTLEFELQNTGEFENLATTYDGKLILVTRDSIRKSSDWGSTWQIVVSDVNFRGATIEFSPNRRDTLYISIKGSYEELIWKSADNGESWTPLNITNEMTGIGYEGLSGITCHPTDPNTLYAQIEATCNYEYRFGLKITTDGGESWNDFGPEQSEGLKYCNDLLIDPDDPDKMIILCNMTNIQPGVFITWDGGISWTNNLHIDHRFKWLEQIIRSPWNPQTVYANINGIFESHDWGLSWNRTCPSLDYDHDHIGHFNSSNPQKMILMENNSGVFWTDNGGKTWEPGTGFSNYRISTDIPIMTDAGSDDILYCLADSPINWNSTILKSIDGGKSWNPMEFFNPVQLFKCNSSTHRPGTLFSIVLNPVGESSEVPTSKVYRTINSGDTWNELPLPDDFFYIEACDYPHNTNVLFILGIDTKTHRYHLFRSADNGLTFLQLGKESGFDITADYINDNNNSQGNIYFHPSKDLIYAGHWGVFSSSDQGMTWQETNLGNTRRESICIAPWDDNTIINFSTITRDGGKTFLKYGFRGSYPVFVDKPYIISRRNLQIIRLDSSKPVVQAGGFGTTRLSLNTPGDWVFRIYAVDPCRNDSIEHLELCIDGEPVGYQIAVDESQQDANKAQITFSIPITPDEPLISPIQFRAMDSFGNLGPVWPALTVN